MKHKEILKLFNAVAKTLKGDWVLVGGVLLHVLGVSKRETLDIDLVPVGNISTDEQLRIMDIVVENGFPPETVNFAASYFLKKNENWKKELVLLKKSKNARIFRPTKKLFIIMKENRGSEIDLADIKIFEERIKD